MKPFTLFIFATTLLLTPLFAVDGTTLINQSTVIAAGGFPFTISQAGSYRLSGNLLVPSNAISGISITSPNVTLDLNGFMIQCVTSNNQTCGFFSGAAGINIGFSASPVRILNGTITGFTGKASSNAPSSGILSNQDIEVALDHLAVTGNGNGVFVNAGELLVTNCIITDNLGAGIFAQVLSIQNSKITNNGAIGIDMVHGLIAGNIVSGNGLAPFSAPFGGILARSGTIVNNSIENNSFGIASDISSPLVGYGSNVFTGNSTDVQALAGLTSMKNNVSLSGLF